MTVRDSGALCIQCGLCCDGTLFSRVRLGDEPHLSCGARVELASDGQRWLLQPCSLLAPGGCKIYSNRPRPCQTFVCLLLQAYNEGEIDLAEALQLINQTKQMIRVVKTDCRRLSQDLKLSEWLRFYFGQAL